MLQTRAVFSVEGGAYACAVESRTAPSRDDMLLPDSASVHVTAKAKGVQVCLPLLAVVLRTCDTCRL